MAVDVEIRPSTAEDNERIHQKLRAYNRQFMKQMRDYSFHVEEDGRIIAGVVAGSTFDTLEVEFLFVEAAYRGAGLGSRLIRRVEELALRDGLKRVLVNTYSFQAPDFYGKMGYRTLLEIAPCFGPYSQYFYIKELA